MNDTAEIVQAIFIGLLVANFFLNTCRVVKAIDICKECLATLNNNGFENKDTFTKQLCKDIYQTMSKAYISIKNYTGAIECAKTLLTMHRELGERFEESQLSFEMAKWYLSQSKFQEAKELYQRALLNMKEIGDRRREALCYMRLETVFESLGEHVKAEKCLEQARAIMGELGDRNGEALCCISLGSMFQSLSENFKAEKYLEQALAIMGELGDRNGEALCCISLGSVFQSLSEKVKAEKYLEKALTIVKEIGDRNGEATCYVNLGNLFASLGEYVKAETYLDKALTFMKEIGDRSEEALCYANLGIVLRPLGEYVKAEKYLEQALTIMKEIGDRIGEAQCYVNLGNVFVSVSEYVKAEKYLEQALTIAKETGDRSGEASCYGNLANVFLSLGEYVKAEKYLELALTIKKEIGDRSGEASFYGNLGNVFASMSDYVKAVKYLEQALTIMKEIGNRSGEVGCYVNLGTACFSLGEYVKADKYFEQALTITKEIGDRSGEAKCYVYLGSVFRYLGELKNSEKSFWEALKILRGIGDRAGVASCHIKLGRLFLSLRQFSEAGKKLKEALRITEQIGDKESESCCYSTFGDLSRCLGDYVKAEEHFETSLKINKNIGCKNRQVDDIIALGSLMLFCLHKHSKAEEYLRKGLALSEESGYAKGQFESLCHLAFIKLHEGKDQEAISHLFPAIQIAEQLRGFVGDNDKFKTTFTEDHDFPYRKLSHLFCEVGNFKEALYVSDLGRSRALADLISAQYSVENQLSADPQTWASIEGIAIKASNSTCLYTSYSYHDLLLWTVNPSGVLRFRKIKANNVQEGLEVENLDEFFAAKGSFRSFGILPGEHCEDRSLNDIETKDQLGEEDSNEPLRENDQKTVAPTQDLSLCYKLIIAPVADFLDQPEVIIIPDRALCSVPFAALPDENGIYFAEKYRIRYVPSLSTLKLIQNSPADYHSHTGALIVGNPDVGEVCLKGSCQEIPRLPGAEKEAVMVGEILGVEPLLGKEATKRAVLQRIHSVSLIHFAAHGNSEKGEILLTPSGVLLTPLGIPRDEDFLLTMADIAKVQLRAKLVVLSCCHSARGQVKKAEGVVGIARAFLGSGARSVLVALWALDDDVTQHFMRRFYENLVRGESVSESLHEAMKWMRDNGYHDVRHWAPFVLIGDNVMFDFERKGKSD